MKKEVILFCLIFIISIATTSYALGLETAGGESTAEKKEETLIVLIKEAFTNNDRGWGSYFNESEDIEWKSGKYHIERKNRGSSNPLFELDTLKEDNDFIIEVEITKITGVDNHGHGIIFGAKDYHNSYIFMVSSDGHYQYGEFINRKWYKIIGWKKSDHIKKNNSMNKLKIEKKGEYLYFYINEVSVDKASFSGFKGNKIGFHVNEKHKVTVDNLQVLKFD